MNRIMTVPARIRNRAANAAIRRQDIDAELTVEIRDLRENYGLEWADIAALLDVPEAHLRRDFDITSQQGATS